MMSNKLTALTSFQTIAESELLQLDDPNCAWTIESGAMAIYAGKLRDGVLQPAKRYLFEVETGSTLFGMTIANQPSDRLLASNEATFCIVAVATTETRLLPVKLDRLESDGNPDRSNLMLDLHPIATWCDRLSSVFASTNIPLPSPELSLNTPWRTQRTILTNFHHAFLSSLQELEQQAQQQNLGQFYAREALNQEMTATAIGDFVSLLGTEATSLDLVGDPLLVAAGAVGRSMNILIRPPGRSEDLNRVKNPIDAIARASGIRIRRVLLTERWWRADCGGLLGYLTDQTPVALLPVNNKYYEIFNPVTQTRIAVNDRTAKLLAPTAYMFYPSFPETKLDLLTLLGFSLRGNEKEIRTMLLLGIPGAIIGAIVPQATGILIDTAIPDADRGLLLQLALALLAATFGTTLFRLTQGFALVRLESYSIINLQSGVWDRLLKLPMTFFRDYTAGEILSRVTAINQIRNKLGGEKLDVLFTSFFALLNLVVLFIYSPPLAGVAVGVAIVTGLVTGIAGYFKSKQALRLEEIDGELAGMTIQLLGGISKLRTTASEGRAYAYWAKYYFQQLKLMQGTQQIEDWIATFNLVQSNIAPMLIFAIAAALIAQERTGSGLSTGTFLAFNAAFATFLTGVVTLSNNLVDLLDIAAFWEYAKPIFDTEPETNLHQADPGRLSGYVKLDHITFRYRADGPLNLDDVTVEAKPGEFIALVGPSGSGKSTILRMLLGFEVPEQGAMYYDGQDLASLDVSAVRRQLGVVLQNGRINSESVFENISGGALISMEEAWEAARMAGFAEDVENMSMGMHTMISEGGMNLSGGQRQRLLIARALVLKPRIIVFDEATSALDNKTQAMVSQSMERLKVTRIAIAHRLSTIRNADRIYVVEAGRVVQQGTFDELASQEGTFAKLMANQGKGKKVPSQPEIVLGEDRSPQDLDNN
jgi:NHLM bacteriocin system ABC transporter ATP-binding protein